MNESKTVIRHGEVLLIQVDKLPRGRYIRKDNYIVGHSESGHHHVLEAEEAPFTINEKKMYLNLFKPAKLVHQKTINKHNDLVVPAGKYKVLKKTEYDPFAKIRREVWD
jgi:hypothetical protein